MKHFPCTFDREYLSTLNSKTQKLTLFTFLIRSNVNRIYGHFRSYVIWSYVIRSNDIGHFFLQTNLWENLMFVSPVCTWYQSRIFFQKGTSKNLTFKCRFFFGNFLLKISKCKYLFFKIHILENKTFAYKCLFKFTNKFKMLPFKG